MVAEVSLSLYVAVWSKGLLHPDGLCFSKHALDRVFTSTLTQHGVTSADSSRLVLVGIRGASRTQQPSQDTPSHLSIAKSSLPDASGEKKLTRKMESIDERQARLDDLPKATASDLLGRSSRRQLSSSLWSHCRFRRLAWSSQTCGPYPRYRVGLVHRGHQFRPALKGHVGGGLVYAQSDSRRWEKEQKHQVNVRCGE